MGPLTHLIESGGKASFFPSFHSLIAAFRCMGAIKAVFYGAAESSKALFLHSRKRVVEEETDLSEIKAKTRWPSD